MHDRRDRQPLQLRQRGERSGASFSRRNGGALERAGREAGGEGHAARGMRSELVGVWSWFLRSVAQAAGGGNGSQRGGVPPAARVAGRGARQTVSVSNRWVLRHRTGSPSFSPPSLRSTAPVQPSGSGIAAPRRPRPLNDVSSTGRPESVVSPVHAAHCRFHSGVQQRGGSRGALGHLCQLHTGRRGYEVGRHRSISSPLPSGLNISKKKKKGTKIDV